MPLQINPETGEAYIQLPPPHETIRITPPRPSDADASTAILNHPAVYPFLATLPYPFAREHAVSFIEESKANSDKILAPIRAGIVAGKTDYIASSTPVQSIREVLADGTEVYIGDLSIGRNRFWEVEDQEERARLSEENFRKQPGDPTIIWTFGNVLAPSHHKRGITTAVIHELIHGWAVPHLNAKHFVTTAFTDNIGSQKAMLKNGFAYVGRVKTEHDLTHKGRSNTDVFVYELKL